MSSSFTRNILTRLFPPPYFLEMPAVGLDISDEAIRFVELKREGNHFKLGKFGEKKIPTDIIELGFIKDTAALTKLLASLRQENGLKFVKVSLPEEKAYLFRTTIPKMDESEIRGALQFKIEENVPVALNSAVFDYKIIEHSNPTDSTTIDVGVTVIHMKVVASYMNSLQAAGFIPLELRTEAQAIAHSTIAPDDRDTYIIVGLRETKTVLAIVSRGVVQFTSTLPIGGKSIIESIKKQFEVNDAEAQKIRSGKEVKESNEMFMSLVNGASVLRDEIQKLFTYWDGHTEVSEGKKIAHVILSGSDAMLGLDSYLSQSFDVPVKIADAWKNIVPLESYIPPINRRESLDYIPALGLALPYD